MIRGFASKNETDSAFCCHCSMILNESNADLARPSRSILCREFSGFSKKRQLMLIVDVENLVIDSLDLLKLRGRKVGDSFTANQRGAISKPSMQANSTSHVTILGPYSSKE